MFLGVIVLGAIITLSGCGLTDWAGKKVGEKIVEKGIEAQTGAKADINSDGGISTVTGKDGSMSFSDQGNAKLPENFPKDVFIYNDAKIAAVISGSETNEGYSINYITGANENDAFSKYKEEMAKNGWKKDSEADMGADGKMLNYSKGDSKTMVIIGTDKNDGGTGKTTIILNVSIDNSSETGSGTVGGGAQE